MVTSERLASESVYRRPGMAPAAVTRSVPTLKRLTEARTLSGPQRVSIHALTCRSLSSALVREGLASVSVSASFGCRVFRHADHEVDEVPPFAGRAPADTAGITKAKPPARGAGRGSGVPAAVARLARGRRYWLRLLLLAVVAALIHLPSFLRTVWNPDEGFLSTEGRQLWQGGALYETVIDRKPPLVPWLYQGALGLFGDDSLWPLRAAGGGRPVR